jgi:DNA-binding MarR family transcriptional regulator
VRPQSMAQTVAELEAEGLVRRRPDPDDRRRALVEMTAAGRSALEADRAHRVGWLVAAIEGLAPAEQDIVRRATPVLRRLAES